MKRIVLSVFAAVAAAVSAQGEPFYWKGPGDASAPANWCTDEGLTTTASAAPQTGDDIVFVAASGNMTWDHDGVAPASWTQREGYTGTVTFKTGRKNGTTSTIKGWTDDGGETRILKITGDCVLLGGTWKGTAQPDLSGSSSLRAYTSGEGVYSLMVDVGGSMAMTNATVDVIGCGFYKGAGPASAVYTHGGGTHAGTGGIQTGTQKSSLPCYGSFRAPVTVGSGGYWDGAGHAELKGGGSVYFSVGQHFSAGENVKFLANSAEAQWYSGAGGSIFVRARSIAGGGAYSAVAGSASGQRGGGGRIAFHLTGEGEDFSRFSGSCNTRTTTKAYGGTVYFETLADGVGGGVLIVDGNAGGGLSDGGTIMIPEDCAYAPRRVWLRDRGTLVIPQSDTPFSPGVIATSNENVAAELGTVRSEGGALAFAEDAPPWTNVRYHVAIPTTYRVGANGTGTLRIGGGAELLCDTNLTVQGSLEVLEGGKITHSAEDTAFLYRMIVETTGDLTVRSNGNITATGKGWKYGYGPALQKTNSGGGIHGGRCVLAPAIVHCYGSVRRPVECGGSGGWNGSTCAGGGSVRLIVGGALLNEGNIDANGGNLPYDTGAGGSVWITAGTIAGGGSITANGGTPSSNSRGLGSGGRIALWLTEPGADFSSLTGLVEAVGGRNGSRSVKDSGGGAPGTVYYKTGDQAENGGTLVVKGDDSDCPYVTEFAAGGTDGMKIDVTDLDVGTVVVTGKAKLSLVNATLSVSGNWTNESTSAIGGEVVFVGSGDSHVVGDNLFNRLTCMTPDKHLAFATGDGNITRIGSGGKLTLVGSEGVPVVLRPEDPGEDWRLLVANDAQIEVQYVDVARSNAEGGMTVVAKDSAVSIGQGNTNWSFPWIEPGEAIVWTGGDGSAWENGANWDLKRVPVETDRVTIPAGAGDPVLGDDVRVGDLTVASGARLVTSGFALTVTNELRVAGALASTGVETLTVLRNADFSGATLENNRVRLCLAGDLAQTVHTGYRTFRTLTAEKGGGSVAFDGNVTAAESVLLTATGAWTADFGIARVTVPQFVAYGNVAGLAALTLTGTDWSLDVQTLADVRGCTVRNSRAISLAVYPDALSADGGGNNEKWMFNHSVLEWTGGSGLFTNEQNWVGGRAPGAGDRARVSSAAKVTLDAPLSILSLEVVGAGANVVLKAPLTVGTSMDVADGGTVTLDAPCVVSNGVAVRAGGKLTHSANGSKDDIRMDLTVLGGTTVDKDGFVDVTAMGFAACYGPGTEPSGGSTSGRAAAHGGVGNTGYSDFEQCYGSLFLPTRAGSGAFWRYSGSGSGGGIVRLSVKGALVLNGGILAESKSGGDYYNGSGGSVLLTCGTLLGSGTISADAGYVTSGTAGGGGRIAVYQTDRPDLSLFEGSIHAFGGRTKTTPDLQKPNGSAGTVYVRNAGDRVGEVTLWNNGSGTFSSSMGAQVPAPIDGDSPRKLKDVSFRLQSGGQLSLTRDLTVWDVTFESSNSRLYLNGHTLRILSDAHRNRAGWPSGVVVESGGTIVWPRGFMVIVK